MDHVKSIVLFFRIRSLGRLRDRLKGSHVQHDHVDVPGSEQKRHLSGEDETMRHTKSAIADDDDMYDMCVAPLLYVQVPSNKLLPTSTNAIIRV